MCKTTTSLNKSNQSGGASTSTKMSNNALILSTGSAYGNHYTTEEVLDALVKQQKLQGNEDFDVDFASRVLKGCGFKYHSITLPPEDLFRRFTRTEYLQHRQTNLVGLAERAGTEALDRWGGSRDQITHLFWGTMTGAMHSPTIDIELVKRLGLNMDVERTSLEGMGCLTGFRLLNLARQLTQADPEARVLVIEADLRSALGNSLPKNPSRSDIVSVCLFRDAASSAVVGGSSCLGPQEEPCYEIITGASRIVDETSHLVRYFETDDGSIRLHLDKKLPDHVALAEPEFCADLLKKGKKVLKKQDPQHQMPDIEHFDVLCHTGGPRVLNEVAGALGVSKSNMQSSWEIMTMHGNLSGASNLAVVDHHNQLAKNRPSDTCEWQLCLSMGPGVCLEGVLLRDVRKSMIVSTNIKIEEDTRATEWDVCNNTMIDAPSLLTKEDMIITPSTTMAKDSQWDVCKNLTATPSYTAKQDLVVSSSIFSEQLPTPLAKQEVVAMALTVAKQDIIATAPLAKEDSRPVVHIVGCGIAGATLAAVLDPKQYKVRLFEASREVREQGYGLAIWPSTVKILRDELEIEDIDLRRSKSMTVRPVDNKLENKPKSQPQAPQDKGFMKRSTLLKRILSKVEERHPGSIYTGHRALRVRFEDNRAVTTYETSNSETPLVTYSCDLLVGADGVNSIVRRYVALKTDSRQYGSMTAYRFLIPSPSTKLLKETQHTWNMSIGESIHSPAYHISNEDDSLNVVVLEYNGKPPSHPRRANIEELRDVAQRSNLSFIINIIDSEEIADLMCYSTFHIDCEPWFQPNAVLIGDAAHAYGPLTAKMANLAMNDAHSLATMLNDRKANDLSQEEMLSEWENVQRPKFEVTRIRTLRHLQLYMPTVRAVMSVLWKFCPRFTLRYFQSIFAYDYEIMMKERHTEGKATCKKSQHNGMGVVGVKGADPLIAYAKLCVTEVSCYIGLAIAVALIAVSF